MIAFGQNAEAPPQTAPAISAERFQELEKAVQAIQRENQELRQENSQLRNRVEQLEQKPTVVPQVTAAATPTN
ncbi:MAG TPA: hypothetical protein VFF11_04875, partial [Candidatus Binatia bacterium]|nr:hypothetical protein [Candidatus Binatia bacterium]